MNTASATKRAVGYLRVSTPGQAGEQHSSLETQESRFKEYCQRQGLLPDSHFDGLELNFTENADWLCW